MPVEQLHFVISAPRSGSTWLCRALSQHPEIFATEHRLFGQFCEVWKNNDGSTSPRITFDAFAAAFAGHYFHDELGLDRARFLQQFQTGFANFLTSFAIKRTNTKVVVDKITPYHHTSKKVAASLEQLLPASKKIRLVRDGRDVVTSGVFDWIARDAEGTERNEFFVAKSRKILNRFFDDRILSDWADHWRETVEVFGGDLLEVRYERMLSDQAAELTRIFAHLGVSTEAAIADNAVEKSSFEKTTGRPRGDMIATAKARRGIAGDWKNWFTRTDGELFVSIAGNALIQAGYESDHNWVKELPEQLGLKN